MLAPGPIRSETIARLNDRARHGLDRTARIVLTSNLLPHLSDGSGPSRILAQARLMKAVRNCTFRPESPERDLSIFQIDGVTAIMKIDYYDAQLEYGSDDPADAAATCRVVTIMAREDY